MDVQGEQTLLFILIKMVKTLKISGTVKYGSENIFTKHLRKPLPAAYSKVILCHMEIKNKEGRVSGPEKDGPDFFQVTSNLVSRNSPSENVHLSDAEYYKKLLEFQEGCYCEPLPTCSNFWSEITNKHASEISICVKSLEKNDFNSFDLTLTLAFAKKLPKNC